MRRSALILAIVFAALGAAPAWALPIRVVDRDTLSEAPDGPRTGVAIAEPDQVDDSDPDDGAPAHSFAALTAALVWAPLVVCSRTDHRAAQPTLRSQSRTSPNVRGPPSAR